MLMMAWDGKCHGTILFKMVSIAAVPLSFEWLKYYLYNVYAKIEPPNSFMNLLLKLYIPQVLGRPHLDSIKRNTFLHIATA